MKGQKKSKKQDIQQQSDPESNALVRDMILHPVQELSPDTVLKVEWNSCTTGSGNGSLHAHS